MRGTCTRARPMAKKETPFDCSRVGRARREAVRELDAYGCTVAEQRAAFGISDATFHRWARDVRLRRRPGKPFTPGCFEFAPGAVAAGLSAKLRRGLDAARKLEEPADEGMPASDALEIATLALLRSREGYSVAEIVEALSTSKSAVYRLKEAPSGAKTRWHRRHIPSHGYLSPPEKRRETVRKNARWKTRARSSMS